MVYNDPLGAGFGSNPDLTGNSYPFPTGGGGAIGGLPKPTPVAPPPPPAVAAVGISPSEYAALLYGKPIPLWIGGKSLIGCRIIEGPFFDNIDGEFVVSGIAGACIPANYANDTRRITQLRMSGKEAWNGTASSSSVTTTSTPMSGLNVGGATSGTEQRIRFMLGTNSQSPDASSVSRYGTEAQAYNPIVCIAFENIRTEPFGNVVPFFSIVIEDTQFGSPSDGLTWDDAITTLAAFDGRASDFSAVSLTGRMDALILGSQTTFTDFISSMREAKPNWSIRTADKLYLVEKGAYSRDLQVDIDNIIKNEDKPIVVVRGDAMEQPRELVYEFIDSNRDYEPSTVHASEDIDATPSFKTSNVSVPVVKSAIEALVDANFCFYFKEEARQTSQYIGNEEYYGIDPGDVHEIPTTARTYFNSVSEITRNPDFTVDVKANGFLTCGIAAHAYRLWLFDNSCHQWTTDDDGVTWVHRITPDISTEWSDQAVAYIDGDFSTCIAVGSTSGRFAYSFDAGANWTSTGFVPFPNGLPFNVAVNAGGTKVLITTVSTTGGSGDYLYITEDLGDTYTAVGTNLGVRNWGSCCFNAGATVMYATAKNNYIAKSADGGTTWADLTGGPQEMHTAFGTECLERIRCSADGSTVIYNNGYTGNVFISLDAGITWTNVYAAGTGATAADCGVSLDGGTMIFSNNHTNVVKISTDSGTTWIDVVPSHTARTCNVSQDGSAFIIGFEPVNTDIPFEQARYIDFSIDGGSTWNSTEIPETTTSLNWTNSFIYDVNYVG